MKDEIFNNYYDKLYYWALKKTGNKEDAKDLVHDIFCAIYLYLNKQIAVKKMDNLIWKIAHNCWCNKVATYTKRKQELYNDDILHNIMEKQDFIDKIIYQELLTETDSYNLTDKELECFNLYYKQDLSIKEISNKLNISLSNIKYYLYNARKKIKERYI